MNERLELVEIGKIVRCHGLLGRVKAVFYLELEENLQSLDKVFVQQANGQVKPLSLRRIEKQKKSFILSIKGIDDIEAAQALAGCNVLMPASNLVALPEGEYYWRELIGLDVLTEEGRFLGKVRGIFPTGSNDVYICDGGEREILLPAIADVVRRIDTKEGIMVVRLMEGL
ncbi:MAG: 16S rRNA processing protein RimM [Deltaproteobacteria bacterium]|nr:16S rRNA processing protein RimM [Deltaproteobacteria bacterium]